MGFEMLAGNDGLKSRLTAALQTDRMTHSYLLSGPKGSGKHTLARLLAAAMECTAESGRPCCLCRQCRKVLDGQHPDVVTVDDPEKKNVTVDAARTAKTDLYVRPNEGKRKIYVIPRAQDLNIPAQNALLKVMEEPPEYGVFLLLCERPEALLPTVRSRCAELTLSPVPEQTAKAWLRREMPAAGEDALHAAYLRSGGFLGQAKELLESGGEIDPHAAALLKACAEGDSLLLQQTLCKMEKWKRDQLVPVLRRMQAAAADALAARNGFPALSPEVGALSAGRTAAQLLRLYRVLQEAAEAADANVGVGHICGYLAVRLR